MFEILRQLCPDNIFSINFYVKFLLNQSQLCFTGSWSWINLGNFPNISPTFMKDCYLAIAWNRCQIFFPLCVVPSPNRDFQVARQFSSDLNLDMFFLNRFSQVFPHIKSTDVINAQFSCSLKFTEVSVIQMVSLLLKCGKNFLCQWTCP